MKMSSLWKPSALSARHKGSQQANYSFSAKLSQSLESRAPRILHSLLLGCNISLPLLIELHEHEVFSVLISSGLNSKMSLWLSKPGKRSGSKESSVHSPASPRESWVWPLWDNELCHMLNCR